VTHRDTSTASPQQTDSPVGKLTIEEELAICGLNRLKDADLETVYGGLQKLKQRLLDSSDGDRIKILIQGAVKACKGVLPAADVRTILVPTSAEEEPANDRYTGVDETPPWESEVEGSELLDAIADQVRRFFVIGEEQLTAVVLWIVHTHAHDESRVSPYLWLWSPVKGCGKSNLLSLMKALVHNPLLCTSITASALFRSIEAFKPCLLIDEIDKFLSRNEQLRGIFQDGHRRGGSVPRSVPGPNNEYSVEFFSTWAPRVIAGLNRLPAEIGDRSIKVTLQMMLSSEEHTVEDLDELELTDQQLPLKRKIIRWVQDHRENLRRNWKPELPTLPTPRARDNWRAFASIADEAGGDWPERVRLACVELSGVEASQRDDGVDMLRSIKAIFDDRFSDRIPSQDLLEKLNEMEDQKWPSFNDGQWAIKPAQVSELLSPFGIRPAQIWVGPHATRVQKRGYMKEWFEQSWARYLPADVDEASPVSPPPETLVSSGSLEMKVTEVTDYPEVSMDEFELFDEQEEREALKDDKTH